MDSGKPKGKTLFTEQQAKVLAQWWGGEYQQVNLTSKGKTEVIHGLFIGSPNISGPELSTPCQILVFSLEEARELENRRSEINPSAPDWVG